MAVVRWSAEEREQLRRLAENGISRSQIARLLGRPKNSVDKQAQRQGIVTRDPRGPKTERKVACARRAVPVVTLPLLPSLRQE